MSIDFSALLRTPVLNLANAISLADALVEAAPSGLSGLTLKAKDRLAQASQTARDAIVARQRVLSGLPERDTRELDNRADRLWGALRDRLAAQAALREVGVPGAQRAGELNVALFEPGGLTFLQKSYPVQLTMMQATLQRIDEDGLAPEIDRYAGPEFLAAIRPVVAEYGRMVSELLRKAEAKSEDFSSHLTAVRSAIVDYAARVYATIDPDEPATETRAAAALHPIAQLRARVASGRPSNASEAVEEEPGGAAEER